MCLSHASHGTTGILPTTMSASTETLLRTSRLIGDSSGAKACSGAEILGGVHLEGPWLNPERKGAQPIATIRAPSIEELDELIEHPPGISE